MRSHLVSYNKRKRKRKRDYFFILIPEIMLSGYYVIR